MSIQMSFDGTSESVTLARRWLVDALGVQSWDRRADDAALCVSELAANVVAHTTSSFDVAVTHHGSGIRVAVRDHDPALPVAVDATPNDPTGRGLRIVAAVATRWGWEPHDGGKAVWFDLD